MMRQFFAPIVLLALAAAPTVATSEPSVKGDPPSAVKAPQAPSSAEKPILPVRATVQPSRKAGAGGAEAGKPNRPMLQFNPKGGKSPAH